MADKVQENPESSLRSAKDLVNKDGEITQLIELATERAGTPEEIMDMFLASDIHFSHGEELTGDYVLVTKETKADWCAKHEGQHLFVVQWHFYKNQNPSDSDDPESAAEGEFVAMHIVSTLGKFIVNDSAKGGMYGQLRKITNSRSVSEDENVKRSAFAGVDYIRGVRKNRPFWYDTRTKRAINKDDLDNTVKHPMNYRKQSTQTWSFAS